MGDDDVIDKIMSLPTFQKVLAAVRTAVAASLAKSKFTDSQPSTHASYEKTRGKGGSQAALLDLVGLGKTQSGQIGGFSELDSLRYDPVVYSLEEKQVYHGVLTPVYRAPGAEDWAELSSHLGDWDLTRPLDCMIQGVVEPLKVRVISKGPALPYYSQKPLQKAMHSAIRSMPCFRLVGQTFDPTMLMDLRTDVESDALWMSIDYSAATDGLSWAYSGRILQEVVGALPLVDQMRAFSVLGPHMLHYPKDCVEPGMQQNGQLMGSPLSFPILCLANLGVYLLANWERFKTLGWGDEMILSHVLCNGDDMLYAAPREIWDKHVKIGMAVGLAMSPGKAYVHGVYSNINSVSCHYDLGNVDSTPWQVNFLNSGLYFGQHKVLSKKKSVVGRNSCNQTVEDLKEEKEEARRLKRAALDSENLVEVEIDVLPESLVDREAAFSADLLEAVERSRRGEAEPQENLASVINLLLKGSLPGEECHLLASFLKLHKKTLAGECRTVVRVGRRGSRFHIITRNLFIPISRGGMGVIPPIGWKYEITSNQRMFAYLLDGMNRIPVVPECCPLPGYPVGDLRTTKVMPYDVNQREHNEFDPTSRPFGFSPRLLRRYRRSHLELSQGIRYYSPNDSVLVRRIRQPFLAGRRTDPSLRPALSEAQKAVARPSIESVSSRTPVNWAEESDAIIWEPDQPYDRMAFGRGYGDRKRFSKVHRRRSWVRDLTDDGDVESNPGPPWDSDIEIEVDSETWEEVQEPMVLPLPVWINGVLYLD
jgi:hypothetical protein